MPSSAPDLSYGIVLGVKRRLVTAIVFGEATAVRSGISMSYAREKMSLRYIFFQIKMPPLLPTSLYLFNIQRIVSRIWVAVGSSLRNRERGLACRSHALLDEETGVLGVKLSRVTS